MVDLIRIGRRQKANAVCAHGHFVCDLCHIRESLEVSRRVCTSTSETDRASLYPRGILCATLVSLLVQYLPSF